MMGKMMGGGQSPMEMMKGMMGEGFSPMEMCRQMTQAVERASEMAAYGTPELRGLFEDWLKQVEEEVLASVRETGTTDAKAVAKKLKISVESAVFLFSKLAREGKLDVSAHVKAQNR
jgi:hypothetical protein